MGPPDLTKVSDKDLANLYGADDKTLAELGTNANDVYQEVMERYREDNPYMLSIIGDLGAKKKTPTLSVAKDPFGWLRSKIR